MAYYDGCRLELRAPAGYAHLDELIEHLKNQIPGVSVEVITTDESEPYIENAFVPEGSQMAGWKRVAGWKNVENPVDPTNPPEKIDESALSLMRVAHDALQQFLRPKG